jgi:hypothetical protein
MRNFFLSFLLFSSLSAQADEFTYNYGVEGGVNLSNTSSSSSNVSALDNRLGVVGGVYWELSPSNKLSFIPGGYIVGKGYRPSSSTAVVLNYFQLRALGRVSLFRSSNSRLFFDFGASADTITQKGTQNYPNPPAMSNFKNFDASLLGGIGFETDIFETNRIVFNIKYLYGLLDLTQNDNIILKSQGILFTTAIQFSSEGEKIRSTEDRARDFLNRTRTP